MELFSYINSIAVGGVALFLAALHTLRDAVGSTDAHEVSWSDSALRVIQYSALSLVFAALVAAAQLLSISISAAGLLLILFSIGVVGFTSRSHSVWLRESLWMIMVVSIGLLLIVYWPW